MRLHEMKTNCRMCGKELIADDKDDDFVSFYCMKCGVYTTKPVEEFKDKPPAPAMPAAPPTTAPSAEPKKE